MGPSKLTRRQILAGLAVTGGAGVGIGSGTAAIVTDESLFPNSTISSGDLDLEVHWSAGDASGSSQGAAAIPLHFDEQNTTQTVDLTVSLPTGDGPNNPAVGWVRVPCPEGDELGNALDVTLTYEDCGVDCELYSGSLWGLASGLPLDPGGLGSIAPGEQRCFQPGDSVDLALGVSVGGFQGLGETSFVMEFVGQQCRNREVFPNPFPDASECRPPSDDGPGISFLAFCATGEEPILADVDEELTVVSTNDEGEPMAVEWTSDVDVDLVIAKGSTTFTIYDLRGTTATSGRTEVGDDDATVSGVQPAQHHARDPCGFATETLGIDYQSTQSIKIERAGGTWEVADDE